LSKKDEQFTPIPHDLLILSHFTGRRTGKQRDVPVIPDSIWLCFFAPAKPGFFHHESTKARKDAKEAHWFRRPLSPQSPFVLSYFRVFVIGFPLHRMPFGSGSFFAAPVVFFRPDTIDRIDGIPWLPGSLPAGKGPAWAKRSRRLSPEESLLSP